jgi:hypothetical protein
VGVVRIAFWLILVAAGAGSLYLAYSFIAHLVRSRRWVAFLVTVVVVGAFVGAVWMWFDPLLEFLHWLVVWIERIVGWVVGVLDPIVRWIVRALFAAAIFVAVVGLAVAFFGACGAHDSVAATPNLRRWRRPQQIADRHRCPMRTRCWTYRLAHTQGLNPPHQGAYGGVVARDPGGVPARVRLRPLNRGSSWSS